MKRNAMVWVIVGAAVCCGCAGRLISEGVGEVKGASGLVMPIQPTLTVVDPQELADYRRFELGKIQDGIGGRLPAGFLAMLREEFGGQLVRKNLPSNPAGKTLLVRGTIVHYEDASTMGKVISPLEEVICRTEFVDKSSGRVLAVANCIGRTNTSLNLGVRTKAEGLAKAFVGWIDNRYPKQGRAAPVRNSFPKASDALALGKGPPCDTFLRAFSS